MGHSDRLPECIDLQIRVNNHLEGATKRQVDFTKLESRVENLETKVKDFPKEILKNAIIGGIIGALIGSGCAPAIQELVKLLMQSLK